jgi:hypothetical protein
MLTGVRREPPAASPATILPVAESFELAWKWKAELAWKWKAELAWKWKILILGLVTGAFMLDKWLAKIGALPPTVYLPR